MAQLVKNPPAMRETWVRSLGWEDPLEKGKATHSNILTWRVEGRKESDTTEQLSRLGASLVAQMVKRLPAMPETRVRFLGQEDPLEKEMAIHSNTLAWKIDGRRTLIGYSPWGRKESGTTERLHFHFWEGKGRLESH